MTYRKLKAIFRKHVNMNDEPDFLPLVLGTVVANRLNSEPVWLMIIAPPAGGKSRYVQTLEKCPEVEFVSLMSEKSLLSAAKAKDTVDGKEASLLANLDGRNIIIKDASTITSMNSNSRGIIFSQLRAAFDGELEGHSGLGKKKFKAKFGMIIAGTADLERVRTFESSLGERFVYFRPLVQKPKETWGKVQDQQDNTVMANELSDSVANFMAIIGKPGRIIYPPDLIKYAETLVQLRASVYRNRQTRAIDYPVDDGIEAPFRVGKQLAALYSSLVHILDNENTAMSIIKRVTIDSVPYTRLRLMRELCWCNSHGMTQTEAVERMKMSRSAVKMLAEEMVYLGILRDEQTKNHHKYWLQDEYKNLFKIRAR